MWLSIRCKLSTTLLSIAFPSIKMIPSNFHLSYFERLCILLHVKYFCVYKKVDYATRVVISTGLQKCGFQTDNNCIQKEKNN